MSHWALLAFASCLFGTGRNEAAASEAGAPPWSSAPPVSVGQQLELAPPEAERRGFEHFRGAMAVGADGKTVGTIQDFLLDEQTGQIGFVVISSGGFLGLGDTLRLVAIDAVRRERSDGQIRVNLTRDQWPNARTISDRELSEGRITMTDPTRSKRKLVRASVLIDRTVRVGEREVGEIEGVVIDLDTAIAKALLDPEREFTGTGRKMLVPLGRLSFPESGGGSLATTLTRSDFNDLFASWNQTTGPKQPPAVADKHRAERGLPPLRDPNPVDVPRQRNGRTPER